MPGKPLETQPLNLPLIDFKHFHRSAEVGLVSVISFRLTRHSVAYSRFMFS